MSTPPIILRAGWRDWLAVCALENACFGPDRWGALDVLMALLGSGVPLKAMVNQQLAGFVLGDLHLADDYAWIATLGVHPAYQRQGLGARLLTAVEARLPVTCLKLTVRETNLPAIALYQKFGYTQVRLSPGYYAGGVDGIVMEKWRSPHA